MKRRILIFSCLLAALSILLTLFLNGLVISRNFNAEMQREVRAEVNYLRRAVELSGEDYLNSLTYHNEHRITWIAPDGAVLFDSDADSASMENHLQRPEVTQALQLGAGESIRDSATLGQQSYYYAVRLTDDSVIRLASTTDSVLGSLMELVPLTLLGALGVFLIALFLATRLTRRIVRPINELDLDLPDDKRIYEELAPLLQRIRQQHQTISEQMSLLQQKQNEFTTLMDHVSEGLLVLDLGGHVLSYNKSALELLGAAGSNPYQKSVWMIQRSEPFRRVVEQALAGTAAGGLLTRDDRHFQLIASPVLQDEEPQGAVVVILDVTEKEERESLRREFSANVSHELKTPLTSISGYAEIIANGLAKSNDIPRFAENIYQEAQRLISLIGDILALSKLEEDKGLLPQEPVDLLALSNEVLARFQDQIDQRGLTTSVTGSSRPLTGIRSILDEMLYNILDNAVKYNQNGGQITVTVTAEETALVLCVADTGRGIPEAEQDRVFERFYRVDKSRGEEVSGTGLGLSIVKHGVLIHGATVDLTSTPGVGTRVTLRFPLSR